MSSLMDFTLRKYFRYRQQKIDEMANNAQFFQDSLLLKILNSQKNSSYGKTFGFSSIQNYDTFRKALPIIRYEDIYSDIELMIDGKKNVLVSDPVYWFAKSSGTTNDRSKYIPVTQNYLVHGHLKCTWTTASVIYNEDQTAKLFKDKSLIMGGSLQSLGNGIMVGDISAIMLKNFPKIGRRFSTPSFEVALIADWDEKIKRIAELTVKERVTLLGGVPTWTIVLFKEIIEQTGAANISEVWPELKTYLHGGIGFEPYREVFGKFLPSEKVIYREIYNASEGYFAVQNAKDEKGMLLLCNHQIFYEFIPIRALKKNLAEVEEIFPLKDVEPGKSYAIVITNSSGLYRYLIGDVIEFVGVAPYKIKVIGRTEQYINVFGEELMIANTDAAISEVCASHRAVIKDYSVGPIYMESNSKGGHEWAIEFAEAPLDIAGFSQDLDDKLRSLNSDYDAKRYKDMALHPLKISLLPAGTIEQWHRSKGKYGGQHKLPRLSNERKVLSQLLSLRPAEIMHL